MDNGAKVVSYGYLARCSHSLCFLHGVYNSSARLGTLLPLKQQWPLGYNAALLKGKEGRFWSLLAAAHNCF